MHEHDAYVRLGFSNDAAYEKIFGEAPEEDVKQLWDFSREMTARLTWKPWMFNRQLLPLLATVQTPSLLVWGADDRIIPRSSADLYQGALSNSRLEIVEGAGHLVEMEQPDALASLIADFAGSA
jgi:pimeloyl-ACP methyl ester carboxylesterase